MGTCDSCGTLILFGGVKGPGYHYCKEACAQHAHGQQLAAAVPQELMDRYVREVHQGDCPKCGGPGPIDVHISHRVWSAIALTSTSSRPEICCRACGVKSQVNATLSSALLGWWGWWGLLFTPMQIVRNLTAIISKPDASQPSARLTHIVKLDVVSKAMRPALKA